MLCWPRDTLPLYGRPLSGDQEFFRFVSRPEVASSKVKIIHIVKTVYCFSLSSCPAPSRLISTQLLFFTTYSLLCSASNISQVASFYMSSGSSTSDSLITGLPLRPSTLPRRPLPVSFSEGAFYRSFPRSSRRPGSSLVCSSKSQPRHCTSTYRPAPIPRIRSISPGSS